MKFVLIASAIAVLSASTVFAQDVPVSEVTTVSTETAKPATSAIVPAALIAQFDAVCESKAVKSKKLTEACATKSLPEVTKRGTPRFTAKGNGKEVNILIANLEFFR